MIQENQLNNYNEIGVPSDNLILDLINKYKVIIEKFKANSDVQIGEIGFKRDGINVSDSDRPASSGYGFGTTGYCVSASRFFLESFVMQEFLKFRNAQAKLISIDIKEQYYGYCYNGSQNYWHTAILVQDWIDNQKYEFVIDLTIRQFGDEFVGHDIWDFNVWKDRLRSPSCTHILTDFDGNDYTIVPENLLNTKYGHKEYNEINFIELRDNLKRNITLSNTDRTLICDFIFNKMDIINRDLLTDSISVNDYAYLGDIKQILEKLYYERNVYNMYSILKFRNKESLTNWTKQLASNMCSPQFLMMFSSIEKACKFYDIDIDYLNNTFNDSEVYLVMEYEPNSVIFPVIESNLVNGILLYNYPLNITELRNTGAEIDKVFNTFKCVISEETN